MDPPLDRDSMATARFITHLRYLFQRLIGDRTTPNEPVLGMSTVAKSFAAEHPTAFKIAGLIKIKLEFALDTECSEDEMLYLALHVARLMMKV